MNLLDGEGDAARDVLTALMRLWRSDRAYMEAVEAGSHDEADRLGREGERLFKCAHAALDAAIGGAK